MPLHPQMWSCPDPLGTRQHVALYPDNLLFIHTQLIHSGLGGLGIGSRPQTRFSPSASQSPFPSDLGLVHGVVVDLAPAVLFLNLAEEEVRVAEGGGEMRVAQVSSSWRCGGTQ